MLSSVGQALPYAAPGGAATALGRDARLGAGGPGRGGVAPWVPGRGERRNGVNGGLLLGRAGGAGAEPLRSVPAVSGRSLDLWRQTLGALSERFGEAPENQRGLTTVSGL